MMVDGGLRSLPEERRDQPDRVGEGRPAPGRRKGAATAVVTAVVCLGGLNAATASAEEVTPVAPAYAPITIHSPKGQDRGRWAERTKVAGDLNKDGIDDLWVGTPQYKRNGVHYGRVWALDGASLAEGQGQKNYPKILYKIHPPEPQANKQFGFWIENPGDLNGDGISEIVVGTDAQDVPRDPTDTNSQDCEPHPERCFQSMGKAWVFDGKNNKVLYELQNPEPQGDPQFRPRFGSRIGRAGDVNGDGVPDIIVGASGNDVPRGCGDDGVVEPGCRRDQGQAFVFSGRDGALIRELNLPEEDADRRATGCNSSCGSFGLAVQGPGDVDGDGVPDQTVGAPSLSFPGNPGAGSPAVGRMYIFSGRTGQNIAKIDDPEPHPISLFGFQDVTPLDPGDVNNDSRADIYAMGFFQNGPTAAGPNLGQGKSWVFDGKLATSLYPAPLSAPLYELNNPQREPGGQFGWSMTRERNRTTGQPRTGEGDPVNNPLYVGNSPHHFAAEDERGATNAFEATAGQLLRNLPLPPPWNAELGANEAGDAGPNLGWTVSSPGDLNKDGFRDFNGGAPFTNVCHIRQGEKNKRLHQNQGVMIVFVSHPNGPPPPNDQNPADNVCTEDQETEE